MSANLHRLRVPLLFRLALLDLAERRKQTEEEVLESIIRDAIRRELLTEPDQPKEAGHEHKS